MVAFTFLFEKPTDRAYERWIGYKPIQDRVSLPKFVKMSFDGEVSIVSSASHAIGDESKLARHQRRFRFKAIRRTWFA